MEIGIERIGNIIKSQTFKEVGEVDNAHQILKKWMDENKGSSEVMKVEYIKLLIDLNKKDEALTHTHGLLDNLHQTLAKHSAVNVDIIQVTFLALSSVPRMGNNSI